jgi:hypothetical protein
LLFGRLQLAGLIERTNMEMRLRRTGQAFTSQGRSASRTKATPRSSWRGIELPYLTFGYGISFEVIEREDSDRRAGMASTAITMTPIYCFGPSSRDKANRPAEATTFQLLARIAHDVILTEIGL